MAERPGFGQADLAEFHARLTELRSALAPPEAAGRYVAHTDGACFGNPEGPGGWAAVVDAPLGVMRWQLWGHLSSTSNNRAEALGVLAALEWVPPGSSVDLRSDSELTVRLLEGRYKARANLEIWDELRRVIGAKRLVVIPSWVQGHVGNPDNELADRLSKLGAAGGRQDALVAPEQVAVPPELAGLEPRGEWESDFLNSVAQQLRRGRSLSPKQQAVIDRMRARNR